MNEDQAIIQKIISDAQTAANTVLQNATDAADKAHKIALENSEKFISEAEKKAREEGEKLLERRVTLARLDGKRVILSCKQEITESVFDYAEKLLCSSPKDKYLEFVCRSVEKYANEGDLVRISVNAPFSAEELESQSVCKAKKLKCEKNGDFSGGVMIIGEKRDADLSFKAYLNEYADKNFGAVAKELFKENE